MRASQPAGRRPRGAPGATLRTILTGLAGASALSLAVCPPSHAVAPAPCGGIVQISDDAGDGHHANTDVLSAWFSEQSGALQAVVKVSLGDWAPAHPDSETAGVAVLFEAAGQQRYVRVETRPSPGPTTYDHGTWSLAGGFAGAGATTGAVTTGAGGTVTIDIPAATGAVSGTVLARPLVLTYDGTTSPSNIHWVDRAPGGVTPTEAAFGADYVVGSCQPVGGGPAAGVGGPGAGAGASPGAGATGSTTAVVLTTPRRRTGAGTVRASGRIVPARGGVTVRVSARASNSRRPAIARTVTTFTDGSYAISIPLSESSTVTAVAEGINAQTRTVTVRSTVRLTLRRLRDGRTVATGVVSPRLPGRVLLLRTNAVAPSATATARGGRFRFSTRRLARGRYQAVFIPSGNRAERSTSNTGVVR